MSVLTGSIWGVSSPPNWHIVSAPPTKLVQLSPQQQLAATAAQDWCVVVGGPGTGKSEAVAASVAEKLSAGMKLANLVVIANTRQAAQTLRRKIVQRTGGAQLDPHVTTMHGFALGLLRQQSDAEIGLLRAPEQELRIRELLSLSGKSIWPERIQGAIQTREFARQLRALLARARQLSLDPESLLAPRPADDLLAAAAEFFEQYLIVCDMDQRFDYAELIYRARLAVAQPDIAVSLARQVGAIVVDDAQELDLSQVALLRDLAANGVPVKAFGDPQARIGDFRGASYRAWQALVEYPDAAIYSLEEGFRGSEAVVAALSSVRQRLNATHAPPLPTPTNEPGEVSAVIYDDQATERAHLAQQLRSAVVEDGLGWDDLAVVTRSGRAQLGMLAKELARFSIPTKVSGDELPVAAHTGVQILLQALQAAAKGAPDGDETLRLLGSPLGGLDSVQQRRLARELLDHHPGGSSTNWLERCLQEPELLAPLTSAEAESACKLSELLGRVRKQLEADAPIATALWTIWNGTRWPDELRVDALAGSERSNTELDAIVELFELANRMSELSGAAGAKAFVAEIEGQEIPADTGRELALSQPGVRLLTAHRAGQGQWRRVWVIGMQEGSWPVTGGATRILDPAQLLPGELSEAGQATELAAERRLFYRALGVAGERFCASGSQGDEGEFGAPSRFLAELGVEVERRYGTPTARLSLPALIAQLRHIVCDPSASLPLRREAALRLAKLGQSHPASPAGPQQWWATRRPTESNRPLPTEISITGSALQTLLECPRSWFLARRAQADAIGNTRASVGDVVHRLAEGAATQGWDLSELTDRLAENWDRLNFDAAWLSASERVEVVSALTRFTAYHQATKDELLGVEVPFEVRVSIGDQHVQLRGQVDRLELAPEGLRVVDLKTGRGKKHDRDLVGMPQLGVYQLAAKLGAFEALAPGVTSLARPRLLMLRHGDGLPEIVEQRTIDEAPTIDEELVIGPTWVHDQLWQATELIRGQHFNAKVCDRCRYCPFADSCPALHEQGT